MSVHKLSTPITSRIVNDFRTKCLIPPNTDLNLSTDYLLNKLLFINLIIIKLSIQVYQFETVDIVKIRLRLNIELDTSQEQTKEQNFLYHPLVVQ